MEYLRDTNPLLGQCYTVCMSVVSSSGVGILKANGICSYDRSSFASLNGNICSNKGGVVRNYTVSESGYDESQVSLSPFLFC